MPAMTYADRYRAGLAYLVDLNADAQDPRDNPGAYPAEWSEDALLCAGAARCTAEVVVSDHRGRLCGQHARAGGCGCGCQCPTCCYGGGVGCRDE